MALPGRSTPTKTSVRKTWVGVLAAVLAVGGIFYIIKHNGTGGVALYQLSHAPLGPTPLSWPEDHRSLVNNDSVQFPSQSPGPNYLVQLPSLVNSDSPVVRNTLYVVGGLGRTGHAGYLWAINPEKGTVRWTATVPNATFSEPIVAEGRVYLSEGNAAFPVASPSPATTPGSKRGTGPSGLYAYNAKNGKLLWQYPTQYADQAPVTVSHGHVFLLTGGRHLDVLNAKNGHLLWQARTDVYVSRSSARLIGHRAYFGGAGPLQVVALNRTHQNIAWKRPIPYATGGVDDTPLVYHQGLLYTAALTGRTGITRANPHHFARVFAIDAQTGKIVWKRKLAEGQNPPFKETGTPMLHGQQLFVGNAINGRFVALSASTGKVLWSDNLKSPVTRPPVYVGGKIIAMTAGGTLYSMSAQSGAILHRHRIAHWANAYGPVLVNHTLFVTGNTGQQGFLAAIPLKSILK